MWILATLASIIASQALISAVFQIVKQAITQGFFPRFTIIHTSKKVRCLFIARLDSDLQDIYVKVTHFEVLAGFRIR